MHDARYPNVRPWSSRLRLAGAAACLLAALSCSTVFTASIQGTVLDEEDYDDGTTTGVSDAKVFLYTDEAAWNEDYAAFANGDESTLPDGPGRTEYRYFQSTVTDEDGAYQFSGFVWKTLFPRYGKTADRRQVYLLMYHSDYGLWRNPVPLFAVSDVTNQLDDIKIADLWNDGRMGGRVLDWADGEGLGGVTVSITVAESWTYDEGGDFADVVYPDDPTDAVTTDEDGYWTADLSFPMMPDRASDRGKGPVRLAYVLDDYRANDPEDGTGLENANVVTDGDLDRDGMSADEGDYEDAYVQSSVEVESDTHTLTTLSDVTLQRWSFSVTVRGRVKDGAGGYTNGAKVTLEVPATDGTLYTAYSEQQVSGETTIEGSFDFGTIEWEIGDATDQTTGEVAVELLLDDASPTSGGITELLPDDTVVLSLEP